jgi:hypothetical protein
MGRASMSSTRWQDFRSGTAIAVAGAWLTLPEAFFSSAHALFEYSKQFFLLTIW